jgi:thiamine biosynthesis lipoprotein
MAAPPAEPAVPRLEAVEGGWRGRFDAMASPCELLIDGGEQAQAQQLLALAQAEALRVERKFSRYRGDSVVAQLHAGRGRPQPVDDETALLLDFAAQCHGLSQGLFDITSGVLRAVWRFDGSDRVPDAQAVECVRARVGWHRLAWQRPMLTLPEGMELDFGGIGKEYAVDRTLGLLRNRAALPMLVNFGGDLAVTGPRRGGEPWRVGIEHPSPAGDADAAGPQAAELLELSSGALATSGDARRYLLKDGVRYSHILDPRTGWPVADAPRSVTVAAGTCVEAGMLSTLAMLQGPGAEALLAAQGVPHWVLRKDAS